jgi:hypothetical protein
MNYNTTYKIVRWDTPEALERILNTLVADGWVVDHHIMDKGDRCASDTERWIIVRKGTGWVVDHDKGDERVSKERWTIFRKVEVETILVNRDINVGAVYNILNNRLVEHADLLRAISDDIKEVVRKRM